MKNIIPYCLLFCICTSFIVELSSDFPDTVQEKLLKYSKEDWPEKVYLHTDKPNYLIGDTIWIACYVVNGITHLKSTKSNVLYLEIIDSSGDIIAKNKVYVDNLSAPTDFKIKNNWKAGLYQLRAYTNYMRNSHSDYFFQKEIIIGTPNQRQSSIGLVEKEAAESSIIQEKPDLEFYPEGGHLVENLSTKVAIKIKNYSTLNNSLSVSITDGDDKMLSEFKTLKFGLGQFVLTPKPNKTYFAHIEVNGTNYSYQLPKALPFGYSLSANHKNNRLLIDVKASLGKSLSGSYLVVHQRGELLFTKLEKAKTSNYLVTLSAKDLKDGVVHITLFNANGHPVCERLVFIENETTETKLTITTDKTNYSPKEKVTLDLNVKKSPGNGVASHLSISVRDIMASPNNIKSENIKTWLLLNSDLRGEITDPNYFFSNNANYRTKYLLDLVMMTNGWRRFTWQNMLYAEGKRDSFPIEKGITLSGTTKLLNQPQITTSAFLTLTFLDEKITIVPNQKSNEKGKFSFGPFVFNDSIATVINARLTDQDLKSKKNQNVLIVMDEDAPGPSIRMPMALSTKPKSEEQKLSTEKVSQYINTINYQNNQNVEALDEVVIKANKNAKRIQEMKDRSFFDNPSYRLDVETDKTLGNQSSIRNLFTHIPGIVMTGRGITFRGGANPRFILNNINVSFETLQTIPVTEISFIDFYEGAEAALYSNSDNGVFVVHTKMGNSKPLNQADENPGVLKFYSKGFYTAKTFYATDYSKSHSYLNKTDIKTTLYWNPDIRISDTEQTKQLSFYTSAIKGDYLIEVEGISDSGIPLYQTLSFSVE